MRVGIIKEIPVEFSDRNLHNRSIVIAREFRKRNIKISSLRIFRKATNFYSVELSGKTKLFEGLPHLAPGKVEPVEFDDKGELKKLFLGKNIPFPEGEVFNNYKNAVKYVSEIVGFPVVVKPRAGSLSKHTTCDIQTKKELEEAVSIVKIISSEFVVEKHYAGSVNRVTMVGGEVVASCLREQPNIIGDGTSTIRELIKEKNENPLRGKLFQKNFTLHQIPTTPRSLSVLKKQGLNLNSIPGKGKKVYLHDKVILACGADVHDNTDFVHYKNIALFKKIAKLCQAPIIGIDFIAQDISVPYDQQKCAVIEVNSQPYIDMHHFPVSGKPRNVAGAIIEDYIIKNDFGGR